MKKGTHHSKKTLIKLHIAKNNISKVTRKKISEAHKGKVLSSEHKRKISIGNKNKIISYETRKKLSIANSNPSKDIRNRLSEFMKGNTRWLGKHHTEESKIKIGLANKGKILSKSTKKKLRLSQIKRMEEQFNNGLPLTPCIGNYETKILNELEHIIGYKINRQHRVIGYFLDGYCPSINLAIEIDEPFHNNNKEKDLIRENNIKEELNCEFLRINVI